MPLDIPAEEFRSLGHRAVDILARHINQLQNAHSEFKTRRPVPDELKEKQSESRGFQIEFLFVPYDFKCNILPPVTASLPSNPVVNNYADLLDAFERDVLQYP